MHNLPNKVVILARGLGTRLRAEAAGVDLSLEQQRVAAAGIKALIAVQGDRTLLDLIYENVVAAGFSEVCLVIGPEHDAIREHCAKNGFRVSFAVQQNALGTANALLAAEELVRGEEHFLVINSDNLYPVACLGKLRDTAEPAMLAFDRKALIANSNIPAERIAKFATIDIDEAGSLRKIVEKPDNVPADSSVSMNAWLFDRSIFEACRAIDRSARGEYELTTGVQYAIDHLGLRIKAIKVKAGVLDLSNRSDIRSVAQMLARSVE